ncbi:MAG: hypothetical protein MUC77_11845 [Chromatiaceae bacterium]|jgi:hypothetical protein|nr:hypothetical protein [Chromatiaceae bacterium]
MHLFVFILLVLWSTTSLGAPPAIEDVPESLRPWVPWVLHAHKDLDCPLTYAGEGRTCVWPGELVLDVDDTGARFAQTVVVYREGRVALPGDREHWPQDVTADGTPITVVGDAELPTVQLPAGTYRLAGRFTWTRPPDALRIDERTGLVRYWRGGSEVRHPQLRDGRLWLATTPGGPDAKAPEDRLRLEVARLLADGHPFEVITDLNLEVSGAQRELVLGKPLLADFIPLRIEGKLPARLEPDGALRVQVRPGRWSLRVAARHPGEVLGLALPAQPDPWPEREVWVFQASLKDRTVEIGGVAQVDPRQVTLPADFTNLPAYRLAPGDRLGFEVLRRGDPEPEPDRLTLQRDLWLDFDGGGYTLRDQIRGQITRDWRLTASPSLALGRVTADGRPQLITELAGETGVEVRRGQLDLIGESRVEGATASLPATGWLRDFQSVSATLHLPPGWRLLAVGGVDNVPDSWLERWTLYDVFLVLIIALAAGRLWRWYWAPLALIALAITWHEPRAPQMIWLYLLAATALVRLVPAAGRAQQIAQGARLLGLVALLVIALPFLVQQAREGLYPQLERPWVGPQTQVPSLASVPVPIEEAVPSAPRRPGEMLSDGSYGAIVGAIRSKETAPPTRERPIDQIDPKARLQTGPGLPSWQWTRADLGWNGPVAADQEIRLVLLGPSAQRAYKWLSIALVVLLAWRFLDLRRTQGGRLTLGALVVALSAGWSGSGVAGDFPSPELLQQLEQRLLERRFEPPLASVPRLSIEIDAERYRAAFDVHALEATAIPLPVDTRQATPVQVQIDDEPQAALYRAEPNQLWVRVPEGQHRVELSAYVPPTDQLQIPLPLRPHRVELAAEGWLVEGIGDNGVPDGQLSLTRVREGAAGAGDELTPATLPSFLRVERVLRLGLEWAVETRVRRASPLGVPLSVAIPLIPGEAVTTDGVRVRDGQVLVSLAAEASETGWRSRLDPTDALTLTAPETSQWIETWRADIGPIWHVAIDGIPPIHHQDGAGNWLPAWHPWPGESIRLKIERPSGAPGRTLTIDASELRIAPGKRASEATLSLRLRASQGGRHDLELPPGAVLQSVKIDGATQPIRSEGRRLSLPLIPGEQRFELVWREDSGIGARWRTPELDLGAPSVNAHLTVTPPQDRWTLWLRGPDLGPAILFWGVLAVVVIAAVGLTLATSTYLPLGLVSWLLLGVGLTQATVLSLLLVAGWFFLLHYRGKLDAQTPNAWFNTVQVGIVLLTFAAAAALLQAVQQGLLGLPEMQIQGYGSSAYTLNWYQDRVPGTYPQAEVLSVPLLVYRGLMLAWALWLAFAVLGWVRWGWGKFAAGSLWRPVAVPSVRSRPSRPDASHGAANPPADRPPERMTLDD